MVVFFAYSAIYWAYEIVTVLIGSEKYNAALPIMMPMVFAFIFFSLTNIVDASIAIPAKLKRQMVLGFLSMLFSTIVFYLLSFRFLSPLISMSYAMLIGAGVGFLIFSLLLQRRLNFKFLDHSHALILLQAFAISYVNFLANFYLKLLVYIVFNLLYLYAVNSAGFITRQDIGNILARIKNKFRSRQNE
jgi:predicted neutral ceramidase superfamily lipid hydrolase